MKKLIVVIVLLIVGYYVVPPAWAFVSLLQTNPAHLNAYYIARMKYCPMGDEAEFYKATMNLSKTIHKFGKLGIDPDQREAEFQQEVNNMLAVATRANTCKKV
jgi:hypothetical protein